jgi:hypothetical protein
VKPIASELARKNIIYIYIFFLNHKLFRLCIHSPSTAFPFHAKISESLIAMLQQLIIIGEKNFSVFFFWVSIFYPGRGEKNFFHHTHFFNRSM